MAEPLDLGHNHTLRYFGWSPDRDLNPQYAEIADVEKAGAIIEHLTPNGEPCTGAVTFDVPAMRAVRPNGALWHVVSWEPLTIEPSVLCSCGDHGFIRNGQWEPA